MLRGSDGDMGACVSVRGRHPPHTAANSSANFFLVCGWGRAWRGRGWGCACTPVRARMCMRMCACVCVYACAYTCACMRMHVRMCALCARTRCACSRARVFASVPKRMFFGNVTPKDATLQALFSLLRLSLFRSGERLCSVPAIRSAPLV